ncbi:type VII secretion protein EccB [Flindersiella endophytica]
MASKRDQLQSYQFLVQRMVSALVMRESDPEQPPFRRALAAGLGTIGIAALALGIVWVYGIIVPGGNKAWQDGEKVIVEKETGTQYVYLEGRLHPATNYTSALLALGQNTTTVQVSRKSLADVPRGPRIGIVDAPDALPDRSRLLPGSWTMCAEPAVDESGSPTSESVLMVGHRPAGGRSVRDAALLVEVAGGDQYLVWRGYRHRVDRDDEALVGMAMGAQAWTQVGATFVDVLPAGEPVAAIRPADLGKPSRAIPGRRGTLVGQVFVVQAAGTDVRRYYLAEADTLRPISRFQLELQLSMPEVTKAYGKTPPREIPLDAALAGTASRLPDDRTVDASQLPLTKPAFRSPATSEDSVCAVYAPGSSVPGLVVDPSMPEVDPMTETPRTSRSRTALADRVIVPPGRAALVEAMAAGTTPRGTFLLVTDMGRAYPLSDPELQDVLGYGGVKPVKLPAWLIARVPMGSGLDPAAAMHQS